MSWKCVQRLYIIGVCPANYPYAYDYTAYRDYCCEVKPFGYDPLKPNGARKGCPDSATRCPAPPCNDFKGIIIT